MNFLSKKFINFLLDFRILFLLPHQCTLFHLVQYRVQGNIAPSTHSQFELQLVRCELIYIHAEKLIDFEEP